MEWLWLLLFAILIIIEALTFNFITVWFALGALGAFISTYFTDSGLVQATIFIIITTISLILTRPAARRLWKGREVVKTNLDSVVGKIGIVDVEIRPSSMGRVTVLGKDWAAKSDTRIKVGTEVEILAIEGVKLIVKEKEGK